MFTNCIMEKEDKQDEIIHLPKLSTMQLRSTQCPHEEEEYVCIMMIVC